MQTVFQMRSIKQHVYSGEPRKIGSTYYAASERDALLMERIGNAVRAAPERGPRETPAVKPATPRKSTPAKTTTRDQTAVTERDGYKRRDQRSEH